MADNDDMGLKMPLCCFVNAAVNGSDEGGAWPTFQPSGGSVS